MSIKVMTAVWDADNLKGNAKLIMLCLADFANDEGYCWPSLERLAKKCGVSRSTVKAQIKSLCEMRIITKECRVKPAKEGAKNNDTNMYWIDVRQLQNSDSTPVENQPRSNSDLGQISAKGGPEADPKPSLDPSDLKDPPIVPQASNLDKPTSKTRKPSKTLLPAQFHVSDEMAQWYAQQNFSLDVHDATNQWADAMIARGSKYTDWIAAWRNGMRNANKWASERQSKQDSTVLRMGASNGNYGPPEGY
ncbi:helix-turn-helix domain-containing protein [Photobacterium sanctipauli]|uniref:Helix-turn-helix domain-containing protein n=1 Tax=Photobacterium sanctipauli TaxID=1342794 RepID=A0A2T3NII5_9GAMM|nr:helix-turn-helix domain-containing protein [Photobacterium sanctipauli]PSW14763.1 helix-turn-helix domain-containing protein [Photobacterium sanctipauli]